MYQEGYTIKKIAELTHYDTETVTKGIEFNGISHKERLARGRQAIQHSVAQLDKDTNEILNIFPSLKEAYNFLGK